MKTIHKVYRSQRKHVLSLAILLLFINGTLFSQVYISTIDPGCRNSNGVAAASVNGGTPPYTYQWSSGSTNASATGLSGSYKGTKYTVVVTDRLGCSTSESCLLYYEDIELKVTITGGDAEVKFCKEDGPPDISLCAKASGGSGTYIFVWQGMDTATCISVSGNGTYIVKAVDSDSCVGRASKGVVFIEVDCSLDPNEIYGPDGYHEEKWVSVNEKLPYEIFFENDPEFATAPAQKVVVNFPIDEHLNMFSFRLVNFGFGDYIFEVPPNTSFYTNRLDLRDSLGVYVDVTAGLDVTQQQAFWIFESIDPATGLPPNDPQMGFLPINDSVFHKGEGFVGFYIMPKNSSVTGDTITAYADITFDINDPLATNIWTNIIDAFAPTSSVLPIAEFIDTTSFTLSFTGDDDTGGCGLNNVALYMSKNNEPYTIYGEYNISDQLVITGQLNDQFRFFSIAKDFVNNTEVMKTSPEAYTTITYNKSISGVITYDNSLSTIMNNVKVYLFDSLGTAIDTTSSDASGYYIFENVPQGSYSIDASSDKTWGGGNATDALGIMLHFILQDTITGLRLMILFEEAFDIVMRQEVCLKTERTKLVNSIGRIIAEDVFSDVDMPPFNKSAMDGYACKKDDIQEDLRVIEVIAAGEIPQKTLGRGECSKIMTGAMVPNGADCVLMIEHTEEIDTNRIRLTKPDTRINIAKRGEDVKEGDLVIKKGTEINSQHIAVMAAVGCEKPLVAVKLSVGVISTGNELVEPDTKPQISQIRNSNAYQLIAQVQKAGGEPRYYGIAEDTEEALNKVIDKASSENDLILLTGGVSMGDFDIVPKVVKELGFKFLFESIAVQPGKPTTFAIRGSKFCFGLPGNPVSSFMQFEMLVKPFIYNMNGGVFIPLISKLPMGNEYKRKRSTRRSVIPVRTEDDKVYPLEYHGSAHIASLVSSIKSFSLLALSITLLSASSVSSAIP